MTMTTWSPPSGQSSTLLPAGVHWDAVSVPSYLAGRVLEVLDSRSGAMIRDPYTHRSIWLTPPGVTAAWRVAPSACVGLLGAGMRLEVPSAGRIRAPIAHWARSWTETRRLTDAVLLYDTLTAAIEAALGPREVATR